MMIQKQKEIKICCEKTRKKRIENQRFEYEMIQKQKEIKIERENEEK